MRSGFLRRRLATVVSVVGVLAVGTAAAAVNVRLLHSASSEPARLAVQTTGGMTVMNPSPAATASAAATPTPAASGAASTGAALATPSATPLTRAQRSTPTRSAAAQQSRTVTAAEATRSATAPQPVAPVQPQAPRPLAPPAGGVPQPLPGVAGPAGGGDDGDGEHRDGVRREGAHRDHPPLTVDQMNVLRIAAMAHVRPDVVIAAAKGDPAVDAATLATIQQVAQYIGVDLTSLAQVTSVPRLGDRWHGNPNDHGGTNSDY